MSLPTIVCLKPSMNDKYLRYTHESNKMHGFLQSSAVTATDPYAQFEVQKAGTVDGLVHLKSRFNNKYLARWSPTQNWIAAFGYAPDENQSSWRCTLFKPVVVEGNQIRLLHIQLNKYACLNSIPAHDPCLFVPVTPNSSDDNIFTVVDWEAVFKLPTRVAFKNMFGYLGAVEEEGKIYFQFSSDDPNDSKLAIQILSNSDGIIHIKSEYYDKFWGLDNEWSSIITTTEDVPQLSNVDTNIMFRVCASDLDNNVSLINMKSKLFCKSFTASFFTQFFCSVSDVLDPYTLVRVVDLDNS